MELELKSYSLKDAEWALICKCFNDNMDKDVKDIAGLLDISERNLYRKIQGTEFNRYRRTVSRAITFLKSEGYEVIKKE